MQIVYIVCIAGRKAASSKNEKPHYDKTASRDEEKDVGYCWEKRDVIAESGHLFRLVKAGFIREHEFLIIGKEKKILQVANSLYLCSRKKTGCSTVG